MDFLLTALLHSGHKAGQRDLWGQLDHWRGRRRSHRHWSSNTQRGRQSSRETESDGGGGQGEGQRQERSKKDITEEMKARIKMEREGKKENKSLWVSETVQEALLSNSLNTFPISVLLCRIFQAGLKKHSSHLSLRIYLISIRLKAEVVARSRFLLQQKSCKATPKNMTVARWQLRSCAVGITQQRCVLSLTDRAAASGSDLNEMLN